VAALVAFLSAHYTDVEADVATGPSDEVEPLPPGVDAFSSSHVGAIGSC